MGEGDKTKGDAEKQTPESEGAETPQETPTLTQKQADALIAKAVQLTKTDLGRLEAELRQSQRIAEAAVKRLKDRDDEEYRKQEEEAKENPDALSRIRAIRRLKEKEAEIEERETKTKTQYEKIVRATAKALSSQYNIDEQLLSDLAGDDPDKMEKLAKAFGERKASGESEEKQAKRMTQEPDSGKTTGGAGGLTREALGKMSPKERAERSKDIAAIPFG